MKKIIFIFALIATNFITAQETCESPEDTLNDLNSITKCVIEDVKKPNSKSTRQISVRISAPKKRYLKKRPVAVSQPKSLATSANTLNGASGISGMNHSTDISQTESLNINTSTKPETLNTSAIANSLSKEELKKALSFENVDMLPAFENCKNAKKGEALGCFNKEMVKHIEKNFSYPQQAVLNKIEGKVWVRFVIDNEGNVSNLKTLGPKGGTLLNNEAVRVISKLPRFTPSIKNGKRVAVKYGLPIHFALGE